MLCSSSDSTTSPSNLYKWQQTGSRNKKGTCESFPNTPAGDAAAQGHQCEGKMQEWEQGREKSQQKIWEKAGSRITGSLRVQSLLIFHLHCQQGNNDPRCLFFWPQKARTPPTWEQNSSLKTIPITKSLFPSPHTSDQYFILYFRKLKKLPRFVYGF